MITPCEVAVKSVVPAVKALITKELQEKHHLNQSQAAEILGISQSAVSKYTGRVRGRAIEIEDFKEIQPLISKMTTLLIEGNYQRIDFLQTFCKACKIIRQTSLMCYFCQKTDPQIQIEECYFCVNDNNPE